MKQNTYLIVGIAIVTVFIGSLMMIITNNNKPDAIIVVSSTDSNTYKLDNLKITYQMNDSDKKMYDINVLGITKTDPDSGDMNSVRISGKACNNQNGNFAVIDSDVAADNPVLVTLDDGRQVIDSPVVSTMMACIDMDEPQYNDAALTEIITNIAKSLESY